MVASESPSELISLQRSGSGDRSSILADRLGKLENASQVCTGAAPIGIRTWLLTY